MQLLKWSGASQVSVAELPHSHHLGVGGRICSDLDNGRHVFTWSPQRELAIVQNRVLSK